MTGSGEVVRAWFARIVGVSSIVIASSALASSTSAQAGSGDATSVSEASSGDVRSLRSVARIVVTDGVAGRFGEPRCRDGETVVPHPAASFSEALVARSGGADAPLVVDAGGLLSPHGVARFAARDLPDALVELAVGLGYDALAFGAKDLAAPRQRMIELARRLAARGVPYVASNVHCEGEAVALCDVIRDATDPSVELRSGTEQAALLAYLEPSVLHRVAPDRAAGLEVEAIDVALARDVRAVRARGAGLVVAVLATSSDRAFEIARHLPDDARPDVVLLAGEGDDLLFARPASVVPAIVSPPPGSGAEVLVGRSQELGSYEMLARPLPRAVGFAPAVAEFTARVGAPYCDAWGRALPGGRLERSIEPRSVAHLAARIVREFAGADVAFLNVGAIDGSFRASDPERLSASDFYVALQYDEPLVVADVPARWLAEALPRLARHHVLSPGLSSSDEEVALALLAEIEAQEDAAEEEEDDEDDDEAEDEEESDEEEDDDEDVASLRIRGRPPVAGITYRVVTIRFLAEGGDGVLPELPEGSAWRMLGATLPDGTFHYDSLRDVVLRALEPASERDPRDVRPSPNDPPEWVLRGVVDGNFAGSSVSNPAGYDAALLATTASIAMGGAVDVHLDATAPDWTWENRLLARYRTQWSPGADGAAGQFIEGSDQVQLRSMASYRGLRAAPSDVWVPDAYVEAFVESELSRPDTRSWHWMLARPTVGARFPLTTGLQVKLQLGLQAQLLEPATEAHFGAGANVLLREWTILETGDRTLTLEGQADFFCVSLFAQNLWQLRSQIDLALDLAGPLALTFGATAYLQQDGTQDLGANFTATAGLRLAATARTIGP